MQIPSRQRPALNPAETAEIWHFVWKWAVVLPAKFSTRCNRWVDSEAGVIRYWVQSPCALYLRSVCVAIIAFRGLRCHLLTCMSLKLRLSVRFDPHSLRHFSTTYSHANYLQISSASAGPSVLSSRLWRRKRKNDNDFFD